MSEDMMRYDVIVEEALRSVVKRSLEQVAKDGLPGEHHFYITFRTDFPGVEIPAFLRERYPEEMTIVLQYQFYGLDIEPHRFSVSLNFNNVPERLVLPFAAITVFADPSVNFALQFKPDEDEFFYDEEADNTKDGEPGELMQMDPRAVRKPSEEKKDGEKGEVVSLDQFRRK